MSDDEGPSKAVTLSTWLKETVKLGAYDNYRLINWSGPIFKVLLYTLQPGYFIWDNEKETLGVLYNYIIFLFPWYLEMYHDTMIALQNKSNIYKLSKRFHVKVRYVNKAPLSVSLSFGINTWEIIWRSIKFYFVV